jgi:hypothetical protein
MQFCRCLPFGYTKKVSSELNKESHLILTLVAMQAYFPLQAPSKTGGLTQSILSDMVMVTKNTKSGIMLRLEEKTRTQIMYC